MIVWTTLLPAPSRAVTRSDTAPLVAARSGWVMVAVNRPSAPARAGRGSVHVFPSSKDAATVAVTPVGAGAPCCAATVNTIGKPAPAGAVEAKLRPRSYPTNSSGRYEHDRVASGAHRASGGRLAAGSVRPDRNVHVVSVTDAVWCCADQDQSSWYVAGPASMGSASACGASVPQYVPAELSAGVPSRENVRCEFFVQVGSVKWVRSESPNGCRCSMPLSSCRQAA